MAVTGADLLAFLGQPTSDATQLAQATKAVTIVAAAVGAYCRDRHLKADGTTTRPGIDEAVLMASARLLANPEQLAYDLGSVSMRGGLVSFSLIELAILNRYRKRAV